MSELPPRPPRRRRFGSARRVFDGAYQRADRVLDHGQRQAFRLLWFFLPETSIARDPRLQQILASRFLSDAGQQALAYGALVAIVREGGSALDAAVIGVATVLPPALLGLFGGAVADALPKRVALAAVYNLQALLCFIAPSVVGTDLAGLALLIFAVNTLGQVSGPTESSVIPLVASETQLASAASLVHLSSSLGTAFGTALLAPVLVRTLGVDPVIYGAGVLLLLAASRVFDLPTRQRRTRINWLRPNVRMREAVQWLVREPAVATMIIVGVVAGTANLVLQTLAPRYVQSVLHVDAADAVYVFAPSAAGLVLALAAAPALIRRWGERIVALWGFLLIAGILLLLGMVGTVADVVDPVNPLRVIDLFGVELNERLRTAGLLALPLGFGVSLTTVAVQTYINRRVPLAYQGRAFALQSTIKHAVTVVPLLTLGGAAAAFGVEPVLLVAPFVLLATAYALLLLSVRFGGQAAPSHLDVVSSFWEEPEAPAVEEASEPSAP